MWTKMLLPTFLCLLVVLLVCLSLLLRSGQTPVSADPLPPTATLHWQSLAE